MHRPRLAHIGHVAWLVAIVFAVHPSKGAIAEDPTDELDRWVPSAALSLGIGARNAEGTVESGELTGSSPPEPVRPSASDTQTIFNPRLDVQLELMSPSPIASWGRPRPFAQVGFGANFGFEYDVVREGTPGALIPPTIPVPEAEVVGQGSAVTADVGAIDFRAGLGAAFTFDVSSWRMRVKPSVQYLLQTTDVGGVVNRAVALLPGNTTSYRLIELSASESRVDHAVGPGIEFEVDATRTGPVVLTPFLSFQAMAFVKDEETVLTDSFTDGTGTETATWTFRNTGWNYSGSAGLRVRWLPD